MTGTMLITGVSSGFGRELAKSAAAAGWKVVGTVRSEEAAKTLVADTNGQAQARVLDVTDTPRIASVVAEIEETVGAIDVLVNNAGYGYISAIEEGEEAAVRHQFDTNVFGLIAVIKQVLPGMRQRRRGHIINLSSIGGLLAFPGSGYYHATKFAVEGLSESLAHEVTPLGIKVTLVEPGRFRTDFAGRSIQMSKTVIDDYAETVGKRRQQMSTFASTAAGDPAKAAAAIMAIAGADDAPIRLLLGPDAFNLAIGNLDKLRTQFEAWRDTSLSTDFDNPTT